MKTLLLMRHAKSDWNATFRTDHARPINRRGRRAASRVGAWLAGHGLIPDLVICSTATRARQTLDRAAEAGAWPSEVRHDEAIYGAPPMAVIAAARAIDEQVETAMIVGHEPGMSMTASLLLGEAPLRYTTAAVARLDLEIDHWADLQPGSATLVFFVPPRLLD